jgi:DNA anti-recombination protein RmuC
MKKIIPLLLVLALVPMTVYAEPEEETVIGSRKTVAERMEEFQQAKDEMAQKREEVQVLRQEKAEIRTQTKEQIQASREELKELKNQMKSSFQSMKDLTPEEREELKEEIQALKSDMKEIHSTNLALRGAAREEVLDINAEILEILPERVLTEEEESSVEDILSDLKD